MAGRRVLLRHAGSRLVEPFARALTHLEDEVPSAAPELTVCLFDTESTGVDPPPACWGPEDVRERGLIRSLSDERYLAIFQVAAGLLTVLDRERNVAVCWVRSSRELPLAERTKPIWRLLQAWLADRGLLVVHGAAVGLPSGGVLLTGVGGAGKSTSALACMSSALRIAGDDSVVVEAGDEPWVHSLFSSARVHRSNLGRMPALASTLSREDLGNEEKAVIYLAEHHPQSLIRSFPLRAVLLPVVDEVGTAELRPASRADVLRSLAPSSVLLSPHTAHRVMPSLVELTGLLPRYELRVGSDAASIPTRILELLAELGVEEARR